MTPVILSFACGVLWLQLQPALPAAAWAWLAVPAALLLAIKALRLPAALALGFCWALAMAHQRLDDRLAPELEGQEIELVGIVSSLPAVGERSLRFEFEPES